MPDSRQLVSRLSDHPLGGVSMANVRLLRLDRTGGLAPGNKSFKLRDILRRAERLGVRRIVSFGGAWSNHLHALAATGQQMGIATVGIVRGDDAMPDTAMLADARRWGMHIVRVSRREYRQRHDAHYQSQLRATFAPCLLVPEGGACADGARGCRAIADLLRRQLPQIRQVVLPVGTGTTLAGLADGLDSSYALTGIAALKGAHDLERRVSDLLGAAPSSATWRILHSYNCGGFARSNARLREFMLAFEALNAVPLEPVYTGKMLLAVHHMLSTGELAADEPVVALHTGGLQGRRGYAWLRQ